MSGDDVQSTLNELERKLRELQAELAASERGPEPEPEPAAPAPPAPPPPPAPPQPAAGAVEAQLEELLRFRDQLAEAATKLVEDYSRLLEQISRIAEVPPAPTPAAGHVTFPVPPPAEPSSESVLYAGEVTIEAAPFGDIAALAAFEEAVRRVPNAVDVVVRSFDEGRAVVGLHLEAEMPLVFELRRVSDHTFDVEHSEPMLLVLTMHSGDLPFPMRP